MVFGGRLKVACSDLPSGHYPEKYWQELHRWYDDRGNDHVAAYLRALDLSGFDPKAPPPKTPAFWDIVDANRAPEDGQLADALEKLDHPVVVTLSRIAECAEASFGDWLRDRKKSRQMPHRLETAGYVPHRNESAADGLWKIGGKRQVVYAHRELSIRDRAEAVSRFVRGGL